MLPSVLTFKKDKHKDFVSSECNSDPPDLKFSFASFLIDFYLEAFEEHLLPATSHLKDDFSNSSYSSETSATSFSEFSSCLRIEHAIKESSTILDKVTDQVIHFYSQHLETTTVKVFETKSNTFSAEIYDCVEPVDFDCLESINFDYLE